jgi:hypothetical protein
LSVIDFQPSTLRIDICPEASKAQSSIASIRQLRQNRQQTPIGCPSFSLSLRSGMNPNDPGTNGNLGRAAGG